jgi:hypothetical protein
MHCLGHRFRGRVVVEFGTPFHIDHDMLKTYRESKKRGYQALLTSVRIKMYNYSICIDEIYSL